MSFGRLSLKYSGSAIRYITAVLSYWGSVVPQVQHAAGQTPCTCVTEVDSEQVCAWCAYRSKVTAYKLVDVPDLGYTAADQPNPRGELRVKTRNMISEYYKSPEVGRPSATSCCRS